MAGLIDSIAGGGGLLRLPALLVAGVSPQEALGTNKFTGSIGTGAALLFPLIDASVRILTEMNTLQGIGMK